MGGGDSALEVATFLTRFARDPKPECRCPQCRRMPPCPRREYTLTALMVHMTLDVHPRRPALKRRVVPSYTDGGVEAAGEPGSVPLAGLRHRGGPRRVLGGRPSAEPDPVDGFASCQRAGTGLWRGAGALPGPVGTHHRGWPGGIPGCAEHARGARPPDGVPGGPEGRTPGTGAAGRQHGVRTEILLRSGHRPVLPGAPRDAAVPAVRPQPPGGAGGAGPRPGPGLCHPLAPPGRGEIRAAARDRVDLPRLAQAPAGRRTAGHGR